MARAGLLAVLAAASAAASSAQVSSGVWSHIQPNTDASGNDAYPGCPSGPGAPASCVGPVSLWATPAFVDGGFYVAGTDGTGTGRLYGFDVVSWVWYPFAATLPSFSAGDLFAWGGFVVAIGGATADLANTIAFLPVSQGPANATWQTAIVSNVPTSHFGHRFVSAGGVVYMVGGLNDDPVKGPLWSNAVWAMDIASFFASPTAGPGDPGATIPWVKIQSSSAPAVFSGRGGFSLTIYSATVYVIGGVSTAVAPASWPDCTRVSCNAFNDIWAWQPGVPTSALVENQCALNGGNGNCGWVQVIPQGATLPQARYNHAAGVLSDHIFVFGGQSAAGAFLTDLWNFNVDTATWTSVSPLFQGITGFPAQLWPPIAVFVGRNLYTEMTGDAGGNAIYRFVPTPPSASGGGNSNNNNGGGAGSASGSSPHPGVTAGLVIIVIVCIVNAVGLYAIARRVGVSVPGVGLQSTTRSTPSGFYTSAALGGDDGMDAAYAPPLSANA